MSMNLKLVLFAVVVTAAWAAEWEKAITIYDTTDSLAMQTTFLDQGSGMLHVLYEIFEDHAWRLKHKKMNSKGEVGEQTSLMEGFHCHSSSQTVIISGSHNGKDIFIVGHCTDASYYDIYFIESHDNGVTWSDPVIPRKTKGTDSFRYSFPQIHVHSSGKLFVFYEKSSRGIQVVTREAGSSEWSEEMILPSSKCPINGVHAFLHTTVKL